MGFPFVRCLPQQWMSINNLIRLICLRLLNVKGFVATASALFEHYFQEFQVISEDVFRCVCMNVGDDLQMVLKIVESCNSYVNFCHFSVFKFSNCQRHPFIFLSGPSVSDTRSKINVALQKHIHRLLELFA